MYSFVAPKLNKGFGKPGEGPVEGQLDYQRVGEVACENKMEELVLFSLKMLGAYLITVFHYLKAAYRG